MQLCLPIKKGTMIYTIDGVNIEKYYVESCSIVSSVQHNPEEDISHLIRLQLERYNDHVNSYKTERRLSDCFLTREELINHLTSQID